MLHVAQSPHLPGQLSSLRTPTPHGSEHPLICPGLTSITLIIPWTLSLASTARLTELPCLTSQSWTSTSNYISSSFFLVS